MTLPASGSISLSQVNTELGRSSTATISLGESAVRTLFGVASGVISMSNGYGKANQFAFTISSNQTNANLATLATAAGWNGTSKVVATISSGVYISSNSTGTPGLTISGSFPGGVELVNNGYIVGMGGAGGRGCDGYWASGSQLGTAGNAGGLALSVSVTTVITNNGTIAGGGGGGGGGRGGYQYENEVSTYWGGGGGGGGRSSSVANSSGGGGGRTGSTRFAWSGGSGTVSTAGTGGYGGSGGSQQNPVAQTANQGGSGGGWGAAGVTGSGLMPTYNVRGGPYAGGSGGGAVTGNSNITWAATGTRLGSIS